MLLSSDCTLLTKSLHLKNNFLSINLGKNPLRLNLNIKKLFQDEKMTLVMLGAVAGGVSGAAGYFVAGKIHKEEKAESLYPLYAAALFVVMVVASKLISL
jgi:hypothetical protein